MPPSASSAPVESGRSSRSLSQWPSAQPVRRAQILASNLRALHALDQLRDALTCAGVPVLYLKGAAFLDTLYPDLGTRRMCDVDFLIPPAHRERARDILVSLGYRFQPAPAARRHSWRHHYNWQFHLSAADDMLFEAHVELCQPGRYPIDHDGLFARAVTYRVGEREIPTLCPEDSLLYAAIHEAKHWFHIDPERREDIRRMIDAWPPDWDQVVSRARAWHITTAVFITATAARIAGAGIPARVLDALRPSWMRRVVLDALVDRAAGSARLAPDRRLAQLAMTLATADRLRDVTGFLALYADKRARDLVLSLVPRGRARSLAPLERVKPRR